MQVEQAKRLKEFEQENATLKRLVAELSLDKLVLTYLVSGKFSALSDSVVRSAMSAACMESENDERATW